MSFKVHLHFPDSDYTVTMPAAPRRGEPASNNGEGSINLTLGPPTEQ
ncbi:hypothetical protein [Streptomyces sp. NPDC017993]